MKRPSLRRIVHLVGLIILVVSVIPFVLYAVPEAGGADQSFVVMSESMSPAIPLGSVVLVEEKSSPAAYEKGDVITFRSGDNPVPTTHRIQSVRETDDGRSYVTKGDANEDPDSEPVSPDQVLGEVTLTIPYAGHLILFANSEYGFYTLIALPLFLLLLDTTWRIVAARSGAGDTNDASGTASSGTGGGAATATGGSPVSEGNSTQAESSSGTIRITATDLRITSIVLLLFTAYSGWTVTQMFTAVTTAVTVGVGFATLAVFGLLIAAAFGSSSAEDVVDGEAMASPKSTDRTPAVPSIGDVSIDTEPTLDTLVADLEDESVGGGRGAASGVEENDD